MSSNKTPSKAVTPNVKTPAKGTPLKDVTPNTKTPAKDTPLNPQSKLPVDAIPSTSRVTTPSRHRLSADECRTPLRCDQSDNDCTLLLSGSKSKYPLYIYFVLVSNGR